MIAFGTLEKHGVNVPVVPIGLNYFRGHRFRARAVVEFGPPVRISEELHELYKYEQIGPWHCDINCIVLFTNLLVCSAFTLIRTS